MTVEKEVTIGFHLCKKKLILQQNEANFELNIDAQASIFK